MALHRNGDQTSGNEPMDRLSYNHYNNTNQLAYVDEIIASGRYTNDIDDQSPGNNDYDAIGNLIIDAAESISTIDWFVNGKIRSIDRSITPTIDQPDLTFAYGPDGQRIRKAVTWNTDGDTTWYVRDAQGNVMATYLQRNDSVFAQEHYMYGSSRLGSSAQWTYVNSLTPHADTNRFARVLGHKNYELTNHLGNVLTTISDQKIAIQDGTTGTTAHWTADVVSYSDYYPFGMMMTGRNGSAGDYRYGFNGKENDNEISGNGNSIHFEFREYDPRLGRFKSIDPLGANYPWQSPYAFAANNPIVLVDIMGLGPGDPPTSTTGDANKKIEELGANLQQSEHFKNVSPEEFINQLTERINNPSGISQGEGTNFCWAAACASYVYEKNPAGMGEAMFSLYTTGTFTYDNGGDGFSFSPAGYINDAAGSGTFDDNAGLAGNKVDQMLFMTLGAKFKGYLNVDDSYDPGDESTLWASGNLGKAKDLWNAFGYDVKVSGSDLGWGASNKGGTVMKTLKSHDVVLFVNSPLFLRNNWGANWTGTHYLRVDKMSSLGGNYTLDYWDYGSWKRGDRARTMSQSQFWWSTYGMIAIPR